jgi:hypothetical protein
MLIAERYSSAIRAGNLVVNSRTDCSPTDVLAGAASATRGKPLAAALLRWFSGDGHALRELSDISASMLIGKAWHESRTVLRKPVAERIVADVIVFYWVNVCPQCQGRGYTTIPGAPVLSSVACAHCKGRGRTTPDVDFGRWKSLATWLAAEYDREYTVAISKMAASLRRER